MEQRNRKKERKVGMIVFFGLPILVALVVLGWLGWHALNPAGAASKVCNVESYGATGKGATKDTAAIQKAIDTCANLGGGTVEFPVGKFLTAPLFLKSNITLQVDAGATILGSQTKSDYTVQRGEQVATQTLALINAYKVNNLGITGSGVIDGQGSVWWSAGLAAESRPCLAMLAHINGIKVTGVTLQNAGAMHLFFSDSSNVTIDHINIYSPSNSPNTDGIDPAASHHVIISNCTIDVGDDNIAIKSGEVQSAYPYAGTSDMVIKNCTFKHGHGVSIGSETNGGVQNVQVLNSTFNGTTNGIRIKSTRSVGGDISKITYSGLTMTNVTHPIIFTGYYPQIPATGDPAQPITATTPYYHDITVDGLTATGASSVGDIIGVTEKPLKNITLKNVVISGSTGLIVRNAVVTISGRTKITAQSGSGFIVQPKASVTLTATATPISTSANPTATKTLVVAQDGSGQYSTVQAAVNAVPANNTVRTIIYIKDGTYNEVVTVPANKPFITFAGQDENKTIISSNNYNGKAEPGGGTYSTSTSASVFIEAPDFLATNLTIQNTAGDVGQAVAADVEGDRANFYKVRFLGWQDTLLAGKGRQYYNNVYVEGHSDYVFGDATAYFNASEFHNLKGWNITAQYRQNGSETTGFVFSNCVINGTPANSTTLGRPWGPYARVVFLNTSMDASIEPVGWQNWKSMPTNYLNSYFAEYNSSGAGANAAARVSWSHQLTSSQAAAYSVNTFLNQDGWLNTSEAFLNWLLANYP